MIILCIKLKSQKGLSAFTLTNPSKLKEIITRHSEFINYPILLLCHKEREVKEEPEDNDNDNDNEPDEGDVTEVDESKKENQETDSVRKEMFSEFEELNKTKPLWVRNAKEITKDEYASFYKSLSNDWEDHLSVKHFNVEGQLEFTCLLYVVSKSLYKSIVLFFSSSLSNLKLTSLTSGYINCLSSFSFSAC